MSRIVSSIAAIFLFLCLPSSRTGAQEQAEEHEDSLVRLLSGKSAQLLEIDGMSYRKIVGPARFFHNNTYLLCDTALWNVDTRVIDAVGNVRIIQDQTELQSEKMKYYIDTDLAEFRGDIVQLQDKDNNTLRTKFLDYNTKDSVAVFFRGGSMRDKDGQIIESRTGTYDSKSKTFDFATDVNMFTDSIFIKTNTLKYQSEMSLATFGTGTNAWKEDNMLSSESGWYDREREKGQCDERIDVIRNAHPMRLFDHVSERAVYILEACVRHQTHDGKRQGVDHCSAADQAVAALGADDLIDCEEHILVVISDNDDIVRVM